MDWNYRVIKQQTSEQEASYVVSEVHYDENGEATYWAWDKTVASADSLDELRSDADKVRLALEKPILELTDVDKSLVEVDGFAEELKLGLEQALAFARGDETKATRRTVIQTAPVNKKTVCYSIHGTLEVNADMDAESFNNELLEWIASKGWVFEGSAEQTKKN